MTPRIVCRAWRAGQASLESDATTSAPGMRRRRRNRGTFRAYGQSRGATSANWQKIPRRADPGRRASHRRFRSAAPGGTSAAIGVVAFDVIGTLFSLDPLGGRLGEAGAPEGALDAWFARTLHHAACLTLTGDFAPFADLAHAALEDTLAGLEVDPSAAGNIIEPLTSGSLPAYPDAEPALRDACESGWTVVALTNGSAAQTEQQLRSAGLEPLVDHVRSVEEVRAYKPHRSVYELASALADGGPAILVAAHAWDVFGARAAGLGAVWVRRAPAPWPFPGDHPRAAPDLGTAVTGLI